MSFCFVSRGASTLCYFMRERAQGGGEDPSMYASAQSPGGLPGCCKKIRVMFFQAA